MPVLLYMIPTHQETVSFHISFFMHLLDVTTRHYSFFIFFDSLASEIQVDLT
jgi:hypothetical protein